MVKNYLYSTLVFGTVLTALSTFIMIDQAQAQPAVAAIAEESAYNVFTDGDITPTTVSDTLNVSTINEEVFFSGQPTASAVLSFREKGVKTIINLRTEEEMATLDFKESLLAESLGIKYINIPIGSEELSDETIELLMSTLEENSDAPLLLHCASSNRVGYVWSMFQGTRGGVELQTAISLGKQAGMASSALEERATQYIQRQQNSNN